MNKLNNKELLELLKTDVKTFNLYREEYADQEIDFSNANLEGVNLKGANLKGVYFRWDSLKTANLKGVDFTGSKITFTYLQASIFMGLFFILANYAQLLLYIVILLLLYSCFLVILKIF